MKTYKNLFEKMIKPENVRKCTLDAAQGKLNRRSVFKVFLNFDRTFEAIMECINNPCYSPCENNRYEVIDGANHKRREIEKPQFYPEQIIHHLLIEPFKPVVMYGLYEQVYGCLPPVMVGNRMKNFGPHAAIKQLKKLVQTGSKIYVCEADIHHAYQSVNLDILKAKLQRVIKDDKWLNLMFKFLHGNNGLVLGHYTSPWLFNLYLKDFDHFTAALDSIKYLRFADNLFLVGTNKRKLHKALYMIKDYLKNKLFMELNKSTQVYRFEWKDKNGKIRGRAVNALGAIIHYNRVTLRKSILLRIRRKADRIFKKKHKTWYDGASMLSRLSWIRFTDTWCYYQKYIKPKIDIRQLKAKIRTHSRRLMPIFMERRRKIYEGLEKSLWLSGRATF